MASAVRLSRQECGDEKTRAGRVQMGVQLYFTEQLYFTFTQSHFVVVHCNG